ELGGAEGFCDVVVSAQRQANNHVGLGAFGGQHDHQQVARAGVLTQFAANFKAVHARQHQIQQDQIRQRLASGRQPLFARAGGGDRVVILHEVVLQDLGDIGLVLDD